MLVSKARLLLIFPEHREGKINDGGRWNDDGLWLLLMFLMIMFIYNLLPFQDLKVVIFIYLIIKILRNKVYSKVM